jgi:hypothetical protein
MASLMTGAYRVDWNLVMSAAVVGTVPVAAIAAVYLCDSFRDLTHMSSFMESMY